MTTDVVHIRPPWWWRPWVIITITVAIATLALGAADNYLARRDAERDRDYTLERLTEVQRQQNVAKGEQECRSARSAAAVNAQGDLMKNMSDLVGFLAARQPDQVPALMAERQRLSEVYAAARENLANAVPACKDGAGN